jgi:flagellar basal-body rod protein FlgG
MVAQQTNVDTIANNLANVNTTGYKTEKAEFKSLLYQTVQTRTTTANGEQKPIPAQVGLGTRTASITSMFKQGAFFASESPTAFAIDGDGFFAVRGTDGETYYTKNGDLRLVIGGEGIVLTNNEGYPVLDTEGNPVTFPEDIVSSRLVATDDGKFSLREADNSLTDLNVQIGLWQFNNPSGLTKMAGGIFAVSDASGPAINEATGNVRPSGIKQGYLEGSNVQVADEMVNLIVAQRAYEMNSKAIQASDEMLGQANQLKR